MVDEPLIRALASAKAVAFVGSGASVPSGLSDWRKFLEEFIGYAGNQLGAKCNRIQDLWSHGDYLLAAELLQRELPLPTFSRFIVEKFGQPGLEANEIHQSIARLPFSLALTTNIDCLLESVYQNPSVCTWRDPDAVFHAIRSRATGEELAQQRFPIIKLHGTVTDPLSARLTRTHYRDGTLSNSEFNECIKHLITWRTLLFIGYSLRDSGLLYLMDEARLRFGKKFGPHYAIMPETEADETFHAYLRDALSIETITYKRDESDPNWRTRAVVKILRELAGRVCKERYGSFGIGIGLTAKARTRKEVAQEILNRATDLTGSLRADVFMIEHDSNPKLNQVAIYPEPRQGLTSIDIQTEGIKHSNSIIKSVFLQAAKDPAEDYVYIEDVHKAPEALKAQGYANARYIACDSRVASEFTCPILTDGRRVGTLNFESNLIDAYTVDHRTVAVGIADELGQLYQQSEERRRIAAPILEYHQHPDALDSAMNGSILVKELGHDFLLYRIDFEQRELSARHATGKIINYKFDDESLAARVIQSHRPQFVQDAQEAVRRFRISPSGCGETPCLNPKGVDQFGICGPVYACPVRAAGQVQAVLITWLKDPQSARERLIRLGRPETEFTDWFLSSSRQIERWADLLASDYPHDGRSRAQYFLRELRENLSRADRWQLWTRDDLRDSAFCDKAVEGLLNSLLSPAIGLKRIRLWSREFGKFRLCRAHSVREIAEVQNPWKYEGVEVTEDNEYTKYTISRFRQDATARLQHPAMFPIADPSANLLDKDPLGSWLVAPIVGQRNGEPYLEGFISADMHVPSDSGPKDERSYYDHETILQCRAMDVASNFAQYVIRSMSRSRGMSTATRA